MNNTCLFLEGGVDIYLFTLILNIVILSRLFPSVNVRTLMFTKPVLFLPSIVLRSYTRFFKHMEFSVKVFLCLKMC